MTIGKRPGGLTALGIIHLVFGALGILGLIMVAGMFALLSSGVIDDVLEEAAQEAAVEAGDLEDVLEEAAQEPATDAEDVPAPEGDVEVPDDPDGEIVEEVVVEREEAPELKEFRLMFEGPQKSLLILSLALSLVITVLQILSGIGYLGQKRVLGRAIGNVYGILSLVGVGISLMVPQPGASQWMVLTNMVLPVITLVLINTTFKDDLVR